MPARVAKLADARDLKSRVLNRTYRFNSGPGHQVNSSLIMHFSPSLQCPLRCAQCLRFSSADALPNAFSALPMFHSRLYIRVSRMDQAG
jgi:hypothetical protein